MIDAHVHFWRLERGDYGWLTPDLPIHRDVHPSDLKPLREAAGVDGVIAVQAAPTEAETRYLLGLAAADPAIRGVVGWFDMAASDAPERLARLSDDPALRGVRPMWQDIEDTDWPLRPDLDPAYHAIIELGLAFDALAQVRHLPLIPRLLERHPALRLVVDHGAKPDIARGDYAAWRNAIREVAAIPSVHCKLSGLVTEAAPGADRETLRPYVDALLELFGPERLIFGSDWPVVTMRCDYATWWSWARDLAPNDHGIFGLNAERFYRLGPTPSDART